jgi:nitrogen fixation NifU-like protein
MYGRIVKYSPAVFVLLKIPRLMQSTQLFGILINMNIYQERLMDHYRNPRNRGVLQDADFTTGQYNPSCGDSVALQGKVEQDILTHLMFEGSGCVISQASASLLTQYAIGKSLDELANLDTDAYIAFLGITVGPTRLKCALLALHALHKGIEDVRKRTS